MWRLFNQLVEGGEVTIFLSSHDVQEIAAMCTRIGITRKGHKTWEGTPGELTDRGADLVEAFNDKLEGQGASFQAM